MLKKRLIGLFLSLCLVLPIFSVTSYAIDTPYKGMTPRELAELEQFLPDNFAFYSYNELDITEYEGMDSVNLFGAYFTSIEHIDVIETNIIQTIYVYEVYVDLSKQSVSEAHDKVMSAGCSIPYKGTLYGNGDVDASGSVDAYDYMCAKRIYFETYNATDLEFGYADIDKDGEITVFDYVLIKRYHFGTYNPYNVEE